MGFIVSVIIAVLVIAGCRYYIAGIYSEQTSNIIRHLTNEYHYAHFSKITRKNWFFTPSLLWTSPVRLTLKAGKSLWIPKGWWHWIESKGPSIAINFWCEKVDDKNEIVLFDTHFQNKHLADTISKLVCKGGKIDIWRSDTDRLIEDAPLSNHKDFSYIISLPGYTDNSKFSKLNLKLYNQIARHVLVPETIFGKDTIDMNFWVSTGFHDTGLHYDDYYGLLCVLEGEKTITLYPPSDTPYLKPFSVVPHWAMSNPVKFEYNTYTFISDLDKEGNLPSCRLLYESILHYEKGGTKSILQTISLLYSKIGCNKVVWGCKLT
ncbi:hypothetical protein EB118_18650, partial [bacterium]|nr:hypothetical protein [bacterium]NDG32082.1 hypothetical protein [bacterium]